MKKKAKILATLGSLCIAIAIMIVGVLAATTAGFDVSSSVSFTSTGVFVKVQGDILKGATASSATKATAPEGADYDYVGYSYNHADGSDEPNGTSLNPDQASCEMPAWTVGTVSFDEDNQTIVYSFKFSNYSAFPITATITTNLDEFRTAYGDKLTITESATGSVSIAQDAKDVEYSIALKLNDFSTSLTKPLSISMTFAKDESTPASYMAPASLDGFSASTSGNTTTFTKGNETFTISTSTSDSTVKETATFTNNGLTTTYITTYSTASAASLNASTLSSTYVVKDRVLFRVTPPSGATELVIPDWLGITEIKGGYIFGSSSLNRSSTISKITLPDGLLSIGDLVFEGCTQLTGTEYGNAYYLGSRTNPYLYLLKAKNTSITSLDVPSGTKFIGEDAFENCSSLTSITLPDGLLRIGTNAFHNCTSLTSIDLPDGLTSIGDDAFYNCTSLTSITLPDSVTSIGYYAFEYCTSLTSITLPDGLLSIGEEAFFSCTQLTGTEYGNAYYLGSRTNPYFYLLKAKNTSITSLDVPSDTKFIGTSAFEGCSSLSNVTLPDGLLSIGANAFYNCTSLTSITLPDGLLSIEYGAFVKTAITTITIPASVLRIGENAYPFRVFSSLTSAIFEDTNSEWSNNAKYVTFDDPSKNADLLNSSGFYKLV